MFPHVCIHVVYIYTLVLIYICMYILVYIYICMYICIYVYTSMYIYIYILGIYMSLFVVTDFSVFVVSFTFNGL
jgi:hypothetical protein